MLLDNDDGSNKTVDYDKKEKKKMIVDKYYKFWYFLKL